MTNPQSSYNHIRVWIDGCEDYFDFKCCDLMVDLYGKFYPDEKQKKKMLIDLQNDKYQEVHKIKTP